MEAVILAAGRGSRLGTLTDERPKCMIELAGAPLIGLQIAALRASNVTALSIVGGYAADQLRGLDVPVILNPRWDETNMVESLLCARDALAADGPLIVSYGDIVFEPRLATDLIAAPGDIATVIDLDWLNLWRARSDNPLADAESLRIDGDGRITDIGHRVRTISEIEGQYIGLTKFSAAGKRTLLDFVARAGTNDWPYEKPLDEIHFTDLLSGIIAQGTEVRAVPVHSGWLEVDTPQDLAVYESLLADRSLGQFYALPDGCGQW